MHENNNRPPSMHATTILAVRKNGKAVIIGDGQVSIGNSIMKATANKIRRLQARGIDEENPIIAGFAGSTADAFTLFERLEAKLELHPKQLKRSCVELAKDWRTDRYLRRLEAMMIVLDKNETLVLTGMGDVLSPEGGATAIGSGGNYALAAARALVDIADITAEELAKKAMKIAADICVFTNHNHVMEVIDDESSQAEKATEAGEGA